MHPLRKLALSHSVSASKLKNLAEGVGVLNGGKNRGRRIVYEERCHLAVRIDDGVDGPEARLESQRGRLK